jgi:hypothetical protein
MMLQYVPGFLFLAAIVGFFLFLRFLDYSVRRDQQKRLAQLAALPCPRCGVPFGAEAADAAREEGERRMAEAMKDAMQRGIRLRVVMRLACDLPAMWRYILSSGPTMVRS